MELQSSLREIYMMRRRSGFVAQVATLAAAITCGIPIAQSADAAAMDQGQWRDTMLRLATPHEGCFKASYPDTVWHATTCWTISQHDHPLARTLSGKQPETVGNGNDYTLSAPDLISSATGSFPAVSGVTTETGTGVLGYDDAGILGANEYSLQLNTGSTSHTAACGSVSGCTVWQQFVYAPDYETKGSAAVFIQYWLLAYGSTCPSGWTTDGDSDCYKNSGYVAAPDVVITSLASLKLAGTAKSGGNDTETFTDGTTAYNVTASDSVLDIASVWKQAEFNVFGNGGGSQAVFNTKSSVTAKLAATYGSTTAPTCVTGSGTTAETNNLILQSCTAAGGTAPDIQFVESILGPPPAVPTGLRLNFAEDCPRVDVGWTVSSGATSYLVYSSTTGFAPPNPPTVASPKITTTNSITVAGPGYEGYIYVWVAAADSLGVSAWSAVASGEDEYKQCP
jgi:hypothetical protein